MYVPYSGSITERSAKNLEMDATFLSLHPSKGTERGIIPYLESRNMKTLISSRTSSWSWSRRTAGDRGMLGEF